MISIRRFHVEIFSYYYNSIKFPKEMQISSNDHRQNTNIVKKNQGRNTNFVKRMQKKREFHQWARKNLISTNNREKIPYSTKRLQRKCTKCTFRQWIAKQLTLLKGRKKSEFCQRATEKCEFRQRKVVHGKTRISSNRCGKAQL